MRIELRWKNEAGIRDRAPLSDVRSREREAAQIPIRASSGTISTSG